MPKEKSIKLGPNCYKCRYLTITWEKQRPYACRGMGFKSRQIPSLVVRNSSGEPCLMFNPKKPDQD